jgi:hypothetical protein
VKPITTTTNTFVVEIAETSSRETARTKQSDERAKSEDWSGREDLNLRPPGPELWSANVKCFIWSRLGIGAPIFLSLSCTDLVPNTLTN